MSNYCKFADIILKNRNVALDQLVETILIKSRKLVAQRKELSDENEQLKQSMHSLQQKCSSQELRINELIEKLKIQQIAGAFGKEEKRTSLKKIDEVMREVDRCMALLNT